MTYAQIDWHDFVVVEQVLFTEADDQADLPPPTSLSDLQSASLEQKAMMSLQPHSMRIEEAMPSEEDPYYNAYTHTPYQATPPQQSTIPMHPPPMPAQQMQQDVQMMTSNAQEDDEDEDAALIRERTEARARAQQAQSEARGLGAAPMKIRSDYVPRAAAQAASRRAGQGQMALCPNCKQQVPFEELAEHMRSTFPLLTSPIAFHHPLTHPSPPIPTHPISPSRPPTNQYPLVELLDPRWKEQRAKSDSRHATTNLSTQDVANNLKRLASQRSDVFDGVTGLPLSEAELARRKKAATSYDGQLEGAGAAGRIAQMQSTNVKEQIAAIHQKFGRS